jgi:glycosyltransferase involved in cell wall biosynthesis
MKQGEPLRVAIVHDWFVTYAGSERVVEQLIALFPQADLFSLFDFLPPAERSMLAGKPIATSFLQRMPLARRRYASYLPLMPLAIEQLDLTAYDLVLSSSHCVAKGVLTAPEQLHVSYIHSPMRYAWDAQHEYLATAGLDRGLRSALARWLLHKMRLWDARTANGVDAMAANSHFIAGRIWKAYRRHARVIHPPVDVAAFNSGRTRDDYYVTASRLVPYKKVEVLVDAFALLPDKRLIVIGDGPELARLQARAGRNVSLVGYQDPAAFRHYLERARAFVYAAREDFGIVLAEAQAAGTPLIALGRGGATDVVAPLDAPQPTGVLFADQTATSAADAIHTFEREAHRITAAACRANSLRFSIERFRFEMRQFVHDSWQRFASGPAAPIDESTADADPTGAVLFDPAAKLDRSRRAA